MSSSISGLSGAGITFGGLASGLDTGAIIQALLAIEQRPINALYNSKTSIQSQKSLFSDLEQRIENLKSSVDAIRKSANFVEHSATIDTGDTYFSATADTSAKPGAYTIEVDTLAQAEVSNSNSYTSGTAQSILGSGSSKLTFTIGAASPVDVDITGQTNSLEDIANAINSQSIGISAQVLQAGTTDFKLVLTGAVGSSSAFTVSGSGTQDIIDLGTDLNANEAQSASDATLKVNNLSVTRTSNQFSDVIPGVTFNLHAAHPNSGTPLSSVLTIATDTTATGAKIQKFVDEYNTIVDFMTQQSAVDPNTSQASSPLFGDSTLRSIRTSLRFITGGSVTTGNQAYELLSQVGISADRDGKLTFSQSEFDTAVTTDEAAVKALFTDTTNGIATRLYNQADDYLDSIDGVLVTRQQGFDRRIKDLDDQIAQAERRLSQTEASLTAKFANLEVLLGRLQSQGSSLGSLSSALGRFNQS